LTWAEKLSWWAKRVGLALAGIGVAIGAAYLAYVVGKRKAADDLAAEHEIAKAEHDLQRLDDLHEKIGLAAREAAHRRAALNQKITDAKAQLDAEERAIIEESEHEDPPGADK
jgi:multidrug resistance efflux pump